MAASPRERKPESRKNRNASRKGNAHPLTRSENMARIKGKNTKPELLVRRAFWSSGLRYRLHDKRLPGTPDLVLSRRHTVVFVNGCFWHAHEGCARFRVPKTNTAWWLEKLDRNRERDAKVIVKLKEAGWKVIVIWECETDNFDFLNEIAKDILFGCGEPEKCNCT